MIIIGAIIYTIEENPISLPLCAAPSHAPPFMMMSRNRDYKFVHRAFVLDRNKVGKLGTRSACSKRFDPT
jgi:hypothetical protein